MRPSSNMPQSITMACVLFLATSQVPAMAQQYAEPLPQEPIPSTETLPDTYPDNWMLFNDIHFSSVPDGRVVVADLDNEALPMRGQITAGQFANSLFSQSNHEIYVSETYYSRLARGERTDVITIYDTASLMPKAEILLPDGKRQQSVTYKNTFQFTNGEKWALVSNFTPGQSVSVVDLQNRKFLNEIDLPGCTQIYPSGARGFTSFCADDFMVSITLDASGNVANNVVTENVTDIDNQPLYNMPARIGMTDWFVSYYGQIQGFDMSGDVAKKLPKTLQLPKEKTEKGEWRPGGWQVIASDHKDKLYILMNDWGSEGSHKDGGTEVWVMDINSGERINRIPLESHGFSIEVTKEAKPRLVVAGHDSVVNIYDATTGAFQHSLGTRVGANPVVMTPVK